MTPLSKNIKSGIVFGIACSAIILLLIFFGDVENPKQLSGERMGELEQAITLFIETNGRAPADLSELDLPEEKLQDHLGEPFMYSVDNDSVTILSYGSDKKPGGNFFKGDYSVTIDLPK